MRNLFSARYFRRRQLYCKSQKRPRESYPKSCVHRFGQLFDPDICAEYGFEYKEGYDFIKYDQIEWYKSEMYDIAEQNGGMPDSVMFMHIPLKEYRMAYNQAKQNDTVILENSGNRNAILTIIRGCLTPYLRWTAQKPLYADMTMSTIIAWNIWA